MSNALTYLTDARLALIQHLHRDTPYLIRGVSTGFFSIARHYGGAKYNGSDYLYLPETDELIRDDVAKCIAKAEKPVKKAKKPVEQQELFPEATAS